MLSSFMQEEPLRYGRTAEEEELPTESLLLPKKTAPQLRSWILPFS